MTAEQTIDAGPARGAGKSLVLVSACLLGEAVRYDGGDRRCAHAALRRWIAEGRVVAACPELAGGLAVPRAAAEITGGAGGEAVLAARARVVDRAGRDYSAPFVAGARQVLELALSKGIRVALLKEDSPSCGSAHTHDGTFAGRTVAQPGVACALLRQAGIAVFSEAQIDAADAWLGKLDAGATNPLPTPASALPTIRAMTLADYDAVVDLLANTAGVALRGADSRPATARYLERNPGLSFVALADGRIVGCLMSGHDGRRGYLQHLAVLPAYRRRGIGAALIRRCLDELERVGIVKSHLDVLKDNVAAATYWPGQGWTLRRDIDRYSLLRGSDDNA